MNDREIGTLRELNVQPGDVVEWINSCGREYAIDAHGTPRHEDGGWLEPKNCGQEFRIISRANAALPHGHARLPSGAVVDLTAITTPFGLLDAETQEALRKHGGPIEYFTSDGWRHSRESRWVITIAYRVKPQPPAPRVACIEFDENGDMTIDGDTDKLLVSCRITFTEGDPASIRMVAL